MRGWKGAAEPVNLWVRGTTREAVFGSYWMTLALFLFYLFGGLGFDGTPPKWC